jgi:CHAT domain-containing protein
MEYEDFLVQIGADGDKCSVRVKSPSGEGAGWFRPPFAPRELDSLLGDLWLGARPHTRDLDPRSARSGGSGLPASRRLGQGLFKALFQDEVKTLFDRNAGKVGAVQGALRIRLEFDLGKLELAYLHRLPWELLCPPDSEEYLGLSLQTSIVRHLDVSRRAGLPLLPPVLRILMVTAGPAGTAPLALEQERREIEDAWKRHREVVVSCLENVTLESLQEASLEGPVHVLHFIGHGTFDSSSGEGGLLFESEGGKGQPVDGPSLSVLINSFPDLRLVVLNACSTARALADGDLNPFAGVATALVRAGALAVVAMQSPISDRAALAFSKTFYRTLAAGSPIDSALTHGRLAIHAACPGSAEWATPVLFLRAGDGATWAGSSSSMESWTFPACPWPAGGRRSPWNPSTWRCAEISPTLTNERRAVPCWNNRPCSSTTSPSSRICLRASSTCGV